MSSNDYATAFEITEDFDTTENLADARKLSSTSDVVGKVTVGYQGWFTVANDSPNDPMKGWWHWAKNMQSPMAANNTNIKAWPDMSDFTQTYATSYPNLQGGGPSHLYSNYDNSTTNTQFKWMAETGIHTAALQRFNPTGGEGPIRDYVTGAVKVAAEANDVKFYIMYDVSGWTNMETELPNDWTTKMQAYTNSSAYARHNGKPVVCIWGFGFDDDNHTFTPDQATTVINFFKNQGVYLIGGVPTSWRTGSNSNGVRAGFLDVYHSFDMITPWMIGSISNNAQADSYAADTARLDKADLDAYGVDYQPCILPGDLSTHQRAHGNFMWRQFYNMVNLNVSGIYISMFDEYNEGNQIAKTATIQADTPLGGNYVTLDEDGIACSSDYYMRLSVDGGKMLAGEIPLSRVRPTAPTVGSASGTVTAVQFVSRTNNKFVTAEDGGKQALIANRAAAGPWETFDLVDSGLGDGSVALLSHANNMYITATNNKTALFANSTTIGTGEIFDVELLPSSGGAYALKAHANGQYVTATASGNGSLVPSAWVVGGWEQFSFNEVPTGICTGPNCPTGPSAAVESSSSSFSAEGAVSSSSATNVSGAAVMAVTALYAIRHLFSSKNF